MLTATDFRDRFPEFETTPDKIVQWNLDHAYERTPENVWGSYQDMGACLLAAEIIARSPMARDMRTAEAGGSTPYAEQRRLLQQIVAAGPRVAGIPAALAGRLTDGI